MILPIGDAPNPKNWIPWVTWGLIAANVLVYFFASLPLSLAPVDPSDPTLAAWLSSLGEDVDKNLLLHVASGVSAYDLFVFEHGYKPGAASLSDLLSAMFLHAGFWHLAGNMLFLWIYGDNVEHRLGRLPFLLAYLATGAVATIAFGAFAEVSLTPLVGASGAISGVLGLYFLFFPKNKVKVLVLFFPFLVNVFLVPARWVLGFYVLVDNLLPFVASSGGPVAHGAHLGGFFAGLGLAAMVALRARPAGAPHQGKAEALPELLLERGMARLRAGRMVDAYQDLVRVAEIAPSSYEADKARQLLASIQVYKPPAWLQRR